MVFRTANRYLRTLLKCKTWFSGLMRAIRESCSRIFLRIITTLQELQFLCKFVFKL